MNSDLQLQLLGVAFDREWADLEAVSKHKAPYVYDGEVLVQDSTFIRAHFETKLGKSLDQHLSAAERAQSWALERMLEDHLMPIIAYERWGEDDNFTRGPSQFFAAIPEPVREQVMQQARQQVVGTLDAQGIGRHSRAERMELAKRDLTAFAVSLGDKPYLFGAEASGIEGAACGVLLTGGTRFFDSPLPDLIEAYDNIPPYLERLRERFFRDPGWGKPA